MVLRYKQNEDDIWNALLYNKNFIVLTTVVATLPFCLRKVTNILREHFASPASHGGEYSRSQIPGGVDCITTVKSECHSDQKYNKTNDEWREAWARFAAILFVNQGEDKCDQHCGTEELLNEICVKFLGSLAAPHNIDYFRYGAVFIFIGYVKQLISK